MPNSEPRVRNFGSVHRSIRLEPAVPGGVAGAEGALSAVEAVAKVEKIRERFKMRIAEIDARQSQGDTVKRTLDSSQ